LIFGEEILQSNYFQSENVIAHDFFQILGKTVTFAACLHQLELLKNRRMLFLQFRQQAVDKAGPAKASVTFCFAIPNKANAPK
jgi:hypothetical protein